jgi:starch phosphorylase
MRESMARLTPRFSANRAVREYTERHYLPAALAFGARITDKGELGKQMIDWQRDLDWKWSALHFGVMKVETVDGKHVFEIQVYLNNLEPTMARVELYAEGVMGGAPVRQEMKVIVRPADGVTGAHIYAATVSAIRPKEDFTARMTPHFEGVMVPLEDARIVWQR